MTRDFAADLAKVFWHMTWDLCIGFAFFVTHKYKYTKEKEIQTVRILSSVSFSAVFKMFLKLYIT